ncbi:hypothetical protein Q6346_13105 [Isoptericola sp. b490]|uniref:hypothetical protein n=1 Tax=Actinotalea lenta TaxID=3064654 RepID=UPI0027140491|nr:hypothetical protein [Isoptericola sp. b490]MDO8122249.1 hypothetical protein [Isoptericola sp. b490]
MKDLRHKLPPAGTVVGVAAMLVMLVHSWWRGDALAVPLLVTAVLTVGMVVGFREWGRRSTAARSALATERPGWTLHGVWADVSLREALGIRGLELRKGTRLTLAWTAQEVAIWRGSETVICLPWSQIAAVDVTMGSASERQNPAVRFTTAEGTRLLLVAMRRPEGSLFPASRGGTEELATELATLAAAAWEPER